MTPEAIVRKDLSVSYSILAQKGLGIFTRTPVLSGKYIPWRLVTNTAADLTNLSAVTAGREGWPDDTGTVRHAETGLGIFVGVETKREKGKRRQSQLAMKSIIESLGGIYLFAESRHDFEEIIFPLVGLEIPRKRFDEEEFDYSSIPF